MDFSYFDDDDLSRLRASWEAVQVARPVHYSLFTFGESELPYYLVCHAQPPARTVTIARGMVRIKRPLIITPDTARPEFRNFFENDEGERIADFILSRSAAFSNLKFENQQGPSQIVTDSVEEAVDRLNRQLDAEEEDRVAIITAPQELAGFAVFRYAAERVLNSVPDNLQELRERGFLPGW